MCSASTRARAVGGARQIGYVFGGDRGLYDRLSALDNLRYFADLYKVSPARREAADRGAPRAGRSHGRERERVETFSRGMRQRLHIARGLLHDPEILFLDEPTIGLDPVGALELRETIAGLKTAGKTILLTTHYMFEADALCDRIAVIANGAIHCQRNAVRSQGGGRRQHDRRDRDVRRRGARGRAVAVACRASPESASRREIRRRCVLVQSPQWRRARSGLLRELDGVNIGQRDHARADPGGRVHRTGSRVVIPALLDRDVAPREAVLAQSVRRQRRDPVADSLRDDRLLPPRCQGRPAASC